MITKYLKEPKNILILALLVGCFIFGYAHFFKSDGVYKLKVKQLEQANIDLQNERKKLGIELSSVKLDFAKLKVIEGKLATQVAGLDIEIQKNKAAVLKSRAELDKLKVELAQTRKKIEDLKSNPANRTGDDLLNSLKLKTEK